MSVNKKPLTMSKISKRITFCGNFAVVLLIGSIIGTGDMYLWAINRLIMD